MSKTLSAQVSVASGIAHHRPPPWTSSAWHMHTWLLCVAHQEPVRLLQRQQPHPGLAVLDQQQQAGAVEQVPDRRRAAAYILPAVCALLRAKCRARKRCAHGLLDLEVQLAPVDEACTAGPVNACLCLVQCCSMLAAVCAPMRCSRLPRWQMTSAARSAGLHTAADVSRLPPRSQAETLQTQASETACD